LISTASKVFETEVKVQAKATQTLNSKRMINSCQERLRLPRVKSFCNSEVSLSTLETVQI
jgi:hypothetical protein